MTTIDQKHCIPCEGGVCPLNEQSSGKLLEEINQWQVSSDNKHISRDFRFKNFYQTMAFVNAIAWMANLENHHPDLEVGYNHCLVRYTTHAIDGLSENDFICAAKVDVIFKPYGDKFS